MTKTVAIATLQKNLADGKAIAELVDLYLDFLLERPLHQILVPTDLAQVVASTLRGLAVDPANEDWFKSQVETLVKETRRLKVDGTIKGHIPEGTWEAASHIAAMPLVVKRDFGEKVLSHRFVRSFLREVLTQSMLDFTQVVAKNLPGGRMVTGLFGKAKTFASGLEGVTGPLEQKAKEFVEEALAPSIQIGADLVASPAHAKDLADWRRHVFSTVGDMTVQDLLQAFAEVDDANLSLEVANLVRGAATWDKLESSIASLLQQALDEVGDKSVAEWIANTTLDTEIRNLIKSQFDTLGSPFIRSDTFCNWLEKWGN